MLSHDKVHLIALREALRKHKEFNVDITKQINIFSIINELKIPLAFQPLGNLSGAFIPAIPSENQIAGILINENHPKSRQRYTAAHELCHYIRDNVASFDIETEIIARDKIGKYNDREQIAEAFAAWFLMPKDLIMHQSSINNINLKNLDPVSVYQLSLILGSSYSATINHLFSLDILSWGTRNSLLKIPPKEIKYGIVGGSHNIGWNDIWLMNEKNNNSTIAVQLGDEVVINLVEIPSTGYIWNLENAECENIEIIENCYISANYDSIGSTGKRHITLSMLGEGECGITLSNRRPWISDNNVDKYKLFTLVEGKRHGINIPYLN